MTRCLALDLAEDNIRVNSACPATVWTPAVAQMVADLGLTRESVGDRPDFGREQILKRIPDPPEIKGRAVPRLGRFLVHHRREPDGRRRLDRLLTRRTEVATTAEVTPRPNQVRRIQRARAILYDAAVYCSGICGSETMACAASRKITQRRLFASLTRQESFDDDRFPHAFAGGVMPAAVKIVDNAGSAGCGRW